MEPMGNCDDLYISITTVAKTIQTDNSPYEYMSAPGNAANS